jgi:ATP-dependent DNA helicase RecG
VVDEQHRFGVAQRAKLWQKNENFFPHILVMTATPIPRTLAMTLYGDLDVSVIDELPPGRKPIKTVHRYDKSRLQVFEFLREQMRRGRQVYIVYPLIEESEKLDLKHLEDGYESVRRAFPDVAVSCVHGRMNPGDKDFEMQQFVEGKSQIMVATTVIEVGVDVPNASVMVIENAERFGLAQLHQLRGRVGRGAAKSTCLLLYQEPLGETAKSRLTIMRETEDGFRIAEEDLRLRGAGEMLGTQQAGLPLFRIADLVAHGDLLAAARDDAALILARDGNLITARGEALRTLLYLFERDEAVKLLSAG